LSSSNAFGSSHLLIILYSKPFFSTNQRQLVLLVRWFVQIPGEFVAYQYAKFDTREPIRNSPLITRIMWLWFYLWNVSESWRLLGSDEVFCLMLYAARIQVFGEIIWISCTIKFSSLFIVFCIDVCNESKSWKGQYEK